jgi:GAF domain-containing protein
MPEHGLDAAGFAALSQQLLADPAFDRTLRTVAQLAVQTVAGCDYAGVTVRHGRNLETPAASDPIVYRLDQAQYDLQGGPCHDAVFNDDTYLVTNLADDPRWPEWSRQASGMGIASVLSIRLATPGTVIGGLNLYSRKPFAYSDQQVETAHIYARHASTALVLTNEIDGLNTALHTRHMIGVAQGLLMQRYGLTDDQAFQFLARVSQDSNVKLREVAERVVAEANTKGPLT